MLPVVLCKRAWLHDMHDTDCHHQKAAQAGRLWDADDVLHTFWTLHEGLHVQLYQGCCATGKVSGIMSTFARNRAGHTRDSVVRLPGGYGV